MKHPIYFKQLEVGPMQNYAYLLGDPTTHEPAVADAACGAALASGATLLIGSCGRVALPGANPEDMYRSVTEVLGALADEPRLSPGHNCADRPRSTIGDEKRSNMMMRFRNLQEFLSMMGG